MSRTLLGALVGCAALGGWAEARVVVFHEPGFPAVETEAPSRETLAAGRSLVREAARHAAHGPALDPGRAAALLVSGDGRVVARYPDAAAGAR